MLKVSLDIDYVTLKCNIIRVFFFSLACKKISHCSTCMQARAALHMGGEVAADFCYIAGCSNLKS